MWIKPVDNFGSSTSPAAVAGSWATPIAASAALAGLGAALVAALAAGWVDGPGTALVVVAALVLLVGAGLTALRRPRLVAVADGIVVRGLWFSTTTLDWGEVTISAQDRLRLGAQVVTLEFEAGDRLIVLGRWDLGADPRDVADRLAELQRRFHGRGQ